MLGDRTQLLNGQRWDLVVIGGGITGAGALLEAARRGLRVLLLEQQDFSWGTSSRSSKMIHGGLRYLAQGDINLTRHALLERERLLKELPGLVQRVEYLFPLRKGQRPGRWSLQAALWLYGTLAGVRDYGFISSQALLKQVPGLAGKGLKGAMSYSDALTDDCRLVLRVLLEAARYNGQAVNYARVEQLQEQPEGYQLTLHDAVTGNRISVHSKQVINATGAWADRLSGARPRIRPLRGSHLFIDRRRLPVNQCLTLMHPQDGRPVFIFPWEGVTCVGTTDLDHRSPLQEEPVATRQEVDYLLSLVHSAFPEHRIEETDIWSTMAGVRPVIASGKGMTPSSERRDHAVWQHNGIISVSGGKLTTFRLIALDALLQAGLISHREHQDQQRQGGRLFRALPQAPAAVNDFLDSDPMDADFITWVLTQESVLFLDDLMLRRTRLGLVRPQAGQAELAELRPQIQSLLGWDDQQWQQQLDRYLDIHQRYYSLPTGGGTAKAGENDGGATVS